MGYILTAEGRRYVESGLPERRLIKRLAERTLTPAEARTLPDAAIAISWAKKNGWVTFGANRLELTASGKRAMTSPDDLEGALRDVEKSGSAREAILMLLLSRQLIEKEREIPNVSEIAELTPEILRSQVWEKAPFRKYDVATPAPNMFPGKKQAYRAFLDVVKNELVALGFEEMTGPPIELSFFNNDALFMPQDHPARGVHDLFFVKKPEYGDLPKDDRRFLDTVKATHEDGWKTGSTGWKVPFSDKETTRLVLRSQGTALSARTLMRKDLKIPGAYFAIARCYRPDKLDATHSMEFNQLEGIVVDQDANFRRLLGLLTEFAKRIAGTDKVRFRPAYFPFVEPAVQGMVWHPGLKKWLEMLPAGILRPEVTLPLGIKVPVLAWGIGIDRLFMVRENITDIRTLFTSDLNWLRGARI